MDWFVDTLEGRQADGQGRGLCLLDGTKSIRFGQGSGRWGQRASPFIPFSVSSLSDLSFVSLLLLFLHSLFCVFASALAAVEALGLVFCSRVYFIFFGLLSSVRLLLLCMIPTRTRTYYTYYRTTLFAWMKRAAWRHESKKNKIGKTAATKREGTKRSPVAIFLPQTHLVPRHRPPCTCSIFAACLGHSAAAVVAALAVAVAATPVFRRAATWLGPAAAELGMILKTFYERREG